MHSVVTTAQAWLLSSWHVRVPFAWLEACVQWLQEEAGEAAHLSQQQVNQLVLDQWLLTDLRDLDYPVLPEGLAQAQKTQLNGIFCVQVDSFLDISQPAYGQLQKWRGTDCTNDEVSAVTQATQRPWEAKTTRMMLLQVTDGVQSLEAMEYQPIPALSASLRPGAKLQLQGQMVCRLGVLLLGPSNVKILGGEVEELVDRNNMGKVLCRTLAIPEDQQQEGEEAPPPAQQGNQEMEDIDLNDAELLASMEAQNEVGFVGPVRDSGYETLQESSSVSSSVRSQFSSRSAASNRTQRDGLTPSHTNGSVQDGQQQRGGFSNFLPPSVTHQDIHEHNAVEEDFPDEDFDDLPLDELDNVMFEEADNVPNTSSSFGSRTGSTKPVIQKRDHQGSSREASEPLTLPTSSSFCSSSVLNTKSLLIDEDMDCFIPEVQTSGVETSTKDKDSNTNKTRTPGFTSRLFSKSAASVTSRPQGKPHNLTALTLTSPPFVYLCMLKDLLSKPQSHPVEIQVKAFIVTLLGKLGCTNGAWSVFATISDGTGYLDVALSNDVLTGLLGFSVAEKGALKRDPARRGELEAGMRRCQEALVDMCCIMTIVLEQDGGKAVVAKADPISETVLQQLEQRVKDRRK
uniref:RecQ-mediated genome instability protein 1 n=1 Tax=Oryzias sinensis TaxID=183150 RepID=A0A8C7Z9E2_9TELE